MHPVVHFKFIAFQINAGKKGIFGKGVVRQQVTVVLNDLGNLASLLVVTTKQKEYLRLERVTRSVRRILLQDDRNVALEITLANGHIDRIFARDREAPVIAAEQFGVETDAAFAIVRYDREEEELYKTVKKARYGGSYLRC